MSYRSGVWLLVHTAGNNQIEYVSLQAILKSDLKKCLEAIIGSIKDPILSIRAVLIDIPKDTFIAALREDLRSKTELLLRRKKCDIRFNEKDNKIEVSQERESKIRTLIVDDSPTMRRMIRHALESDGRFEVTQETGEPKRALELIFKEEFDLITMDLHLPDMTGADLIKTYMPERPVRTVVISSLRPEESELVLQSLENGAIDYIQKPEQKSMTAAREELLSRISAVASAQIGPVRRANGTKANLRNQTGILAIGSSTGGTEAIRVLLSQMGDHVPPTLIVQHIPAVFSKAFAERLNRQFQFEIKEAENGDLVQPDRVLIAPGGFQMKISADGRDIRVCVADEPPVNRHRPSVDVLFNSIPAIYKGPVVGVLLTGMGADGARGMLNLKTSGAYTIAQDEASSVVFGMPREAILCGGATEICDLYTMGNAVQRGFRKLT